MKQAKTNKKKAEQFSHHIISIFQVLVDFYQTSK